jgi:hypothetical protein
VPSGRRLAGGALQCSICSAFLDQDHGKNKVKIQTIVKTSTI